MLAETTATLVAGFSFGVVLFGMILGVVYWVANTRVPNKQCDIVRKNNKETHDALTSYIAATEKRAEERHKELKTDLREIIIGVNGNHKSS